MDFESHGIEDIRSKIDLCRKHITSIKRKNFKGTAFDELMEKTFGSRYGLGLEGCSVVTQSPDVLRLLSFSAIEHVRRGVARNPFTPYEILLYLLKDKSLRIRRGILTYGKLEQEDFTFLSEKFHERGYMFCELDTSKYIQLIKLKGQLASWPLSQSICLLHNNHLGIDALNSIDIHSFDPFVEGALEFVLEQKRTKVSEVTNKTPSSERETMKPPSEVWGFPQAYMEPETVRETEAYQFEAIEEFILEQANQIDNLRQSPKP
jgi:hypothetical protein